MLCTKFQNCWDIMFSCRTFCFQPMFFFSCPLYIAVRHPGPCHSKQCWLRFGFSTWRRSIFLVVGGVIKNKKNLNNRMCQLILKVTIRLWYRIHLSPVTMRNGLSAMRRAGPIFIGPLSSIDSGASWAQTSQVAPDLQKDMEDCPSREKKWNNYCYIYHSYFFRFSDWLSKLQLRTTSNAQHMQFQDD